MLSNQYAITEVQQIIKAGGTITNDHTISTLLTDSSMNTTKAEKRI